jgi:hypothetical protein
VTVRRKRRLARRRPASDIERAYFELVLGPNPRQEWGLAPLPWRDETEFAALVENALEVGVIDETSWAARELERLSFANGR